MSFCHHNFGQHRQWCKLWIGGTVRPHWFPSPFDKFLSVDKSVPTVGDQLRSLDSADSAPGTWYLRKRGTKSKSKGVPRQAKVALGVLGRLRPRIISTFCTTKVVGLQPYTLAAFTPGEIPGTHFQRLNRPQGTWFCQKEPRKKFPVTQLGIDPEMVLLAAQCLNHYTTPISPLTSARYVI